MYANREHVRDIVNRVRTNSLTHEKGVFLSSKEGKQLATLYHDLLSQAIDELYERSIAEQSKIERA